MTRNRGWLAMLLVASVAVWSIGCGGEDAEQGKAGGDGDSGAADHHADGDDHDAHTAGTDSGKPSNGSGKPTLAPDPAKIEVPQTAAPGSAEETILKAVEALKQKQPGAIVRMLPESWQNDANELVHAFAEKMPPEVWNRGFDLLEKTAGVLREKKQFVLNFSLLQILGVDGGELAQPYDAAVQMLEVVAKSEVGEIEKLRSADIATLAQQLGSDLMKTADDVSAKFPEDPYTNDFERWLTSIKVKTVGTTGDTAKLEVTSAVKRFDFETGKEEWQEVTEPTTFVKVEDRWVPERMAKEWAEEIAKVREAIAMIDPSMYAEQQEAVLQVFDEVEKSLDAIAATKDQQEFEAKLGEEGQRLQGVLAPLMPVGPGAAPPVEPEPTLENPADPDAPTTNEVPSPDSPEKADPADEAGTTEPADDN